MPITAAELARQLQGNVVGNPATPLMGFAQADQSKPGDVTFAETEAYFSAATQSKASAIIVSGEFACADKVLIRVTNARIAFAKALEIFFPEPAFAAGVHPTAVIAPDAQVDASAHVGPHCVIGARSRIGARTVLITGVSVAGDCVIGDDGMIFPNVTVYSRTEMGNRVRIHAGTVIGSDGFGYVFDAGRHRKILQVGNVIIGDDVELGANVTVDRGALGPTIIGTGAKIDNLVQIAHNVKVGEHSIIVAQTAIAGSTQLGRYNVIGGQVGISGHLKMGDRITVAAQSGVMHEIPDGETWFGTPAQPDKITKRQILALHRLPDLLKRVAELERKLGK
jgi:UDP-3-O-[3-hydroxymyristoyl] glucosamine N-acyltransferase